MSFNDKQYSIFNGNKLKVEIFGASHSEQIGVKIDGLDGQKIDLEKVQALVDRRKAKNTAYSTKRLEADLVEVESGIVGDEIRGQFKAVIKNNNQNSKDYSNLIKTPRPSHADFVAYQKYGDGYDYRGGGKFSGRLTACTCIAGGICKQLLEKRGIKINAYLSRIGKVVGASYQNTDIENFDFSSLDSDFPLLDTSVKADMLSEIESARDDLNSVGGIIECVVTGMPVGAGEYMFDSLESVISHLAFSVPAVKGIEFGSGFNLGSMKGSDANDAFYYDDNGVVKTRTNHNGGINGGLSNGMPITFRTVIKPTPSIAKEQDTINMQTKQNVKLQIHGRHDACIVPRAVPVIEAITAIAIYDSI